jgi:hypothetical protein
MTKPDAPFKIACLGWGSLIWDPQHLALASGLFNDGPTAPVEFSRQSANGRITLVLDPAAAPQTLLWAELSCRDLQSAKEALKKREGLTGRNWSQGIGVWQRGDPAPTPINDLPAWAEAHGIDAVIWAAFGPKFNNESKPPTVKELLDYLGLLRDEEQQRARQYVENTPVQINTAHSSRPSSNTLANSALRWLTFIGLPRPPGTA